MPICWAVEGERRDATEVVLKAALVSRDHPHSRPDSTPLVRGPRIGTGGRMVLADLCLFGVAIVSDSLALPPQRNMVFRHHLWHVLTPSPGPAHDERAT